DTTARVPPDRLSILRLSAARTCRYNRRMPNPQAAAGTIFLMQILVSAFLAILFLQSGIDKIVDRQGNLQWLKGHFAKSPLAGIVPLLFGVLTIIELAAGALSGIGFLALLFAHNSTIAFYGAVTSAIA